MIFGVLSFPSQGFGFLRRALLAGPRDVLTYVIA